ncbi:glucose-1-phosphate cytidylyltransferase [Dehalococcoidia bacterium]|nr:glucose-1-phosphate cytidylyltransferase [Dehalococcoidia bacterium]
MKTIILAGGAGTRLSEETAIKPKPLVEIGGKPILWHIMNIYAAFGFEEFVLALGYKGEEIKKYFLDFYMLNNDLTIDLSTGRTDPHNSGQQPDWKVCLIDTGTATETGGRVKRLQPLIGSERFMLTYGDGVADIDIKRLVAFHESHGKLATITAVRPPARFGGLLFNGDLVTEFTEKPQIGEGWINGGFFVLEPEVLDYIGGDDTILERGPLERLAEEEQLVAYKHDGFWQCMDTLRDVRLLESLWQSGKPPWKVWKD